MSQGWAGGWRIFSGSEHLGEGLSTGKPICHPQERGVCHKLCLHSPELWTLEFQKSPWQLNIPLATINLFNTRSATLQRMFADGTVLDALVLLTLVHRRPDMYLVAEESQEPILPTSQNLQAECDIQRSPGLSTCLQASLDINQPRQMRICSLSLPSKTFTHRRTFHAYL